MISSRRLLPALALGLTAGGIFMRAICIAPDVKAFLDRLQVACFKKIDLFHIPSKG